MAKAVNTVPTKVRKTPKNTVPKKVRKTPKNTVRKTPKNTVRKTPKNTVPKNTASKKTVSEKTASKKTFSDKTVSDKRLLSIHTKCSWELDKKDIPKDHQFSDEVDGIVSILDDYIKVIPKERPLLAQLTIYITVLNKGGELVVNFTFLDTLYFTIKIGKNITGQIYINRIFEKFNHIPLPDWYVCFLSVCNNIYTDIYSLITK